MRTILRSLAALAVPTSCLAAPPAMSEPEAVVRAYDAPAVYEVEGGRIVYIERVAQDAGR